MRGPETYEDGRPSWVDLATSDLEAAQQFYSDLFGWDYEPVPGGGYYYATSGGHVVAGVALGQNPDFPPMWTTYLAATSAKEAAEKVKAAGGSVIVEPMTVGPAGTMAYCADPQGAAFGLWQGDEHLGAARINEPNTFTWAELYAPDLDATAAFYNTTFGLSATTPDFGPDMPPYAVLTVGDWGCAGTMELPYEGAPPHWHVYFGTEDTDSAAEKAAASGGTVVAGPVDTPVGRMASIQDPQGALFSVINLNDWPE
ncbi:MAG: VOC family protein [Acidimicrobiia bacterium]|nr:VOC family protein [Acidimicrobiia bacterium]